ncbi:MAG: hypothetical protein GY780_08405 [bacterium]|nr:hypothetical protein [bacterium]
MIARVSSEKNFESRTQSLASISSIYILCFICLLMVTSTYCLMPGLAFARTFSVPEDSPTIKGAMIKAQPGDIVLVSCGTYYEHDIRMKSGVALWSGTLQPGCVTIDAQGNGRHFNFDKADTSTALVGFTLTGGSAQNSPFPDGGSILCVDSAPRITNCVFTNNTAHQGGAVSWDSQSHPIFDNCLFKNNKAQSNGGAGSGQGKATFKICAFKSNLALIGGGLHLAPGSVIQLLSSTFQENSAGNTGGGLHAKNAQCNIQNSVFAANWAGLGGSALSSQDSQFALTRSTLYGNTNDFSGAALAVTGKKVQFKNSIIAFSGGAVIRPDSSIPQFEGCNIFGNKGGDWVASLQDQAGTNDNISQDPLFCAPEYGNFSLNKLSTCLPGNNPSGNKGLVGALGAGCASSGPIKDNQTPSGSGFRAVSAGL